MSGGFRLSERGDPLDLDFMSMLDIPSSFCEDETRAAQMTRQLAYHKIDAGHLLELARREAYEDDDWWATAQFKTQRILDLLQGAIQFALHRWSMFEDDSLHFREVADRLEQENSVIEIERSDLLAEVSKLQQQNATLRERLLSHQREEQRQQRQLNTTDKPFSSPSTAAASKTPTQVERSQEKPYVCRVCGSAYAVHYALQSHILKRHVNHQEPHSETPSRTAVSATETMLTSQNELLRSELAVLRKSMDDLTMSMKVDKEVQKERQDMMSQMRQSQEMPSGGNFLSHLSALETMSSMRSQSSKIRELEDQLLSLRASVQAGGGANSSTTMMSPFPTSKRAAKPTSPDGPLAFSETSPINTARSNKATEEKTKKTVAAAEKTEDSSKPQPVASNKFFSVADTIPAGLNRKKQREANKTPEQRRLLADLQAVARADADSPVVTIDPMNDVVQNPVSAAPNDNKLPPADKEVADMLRNRTPTPEQPRLPDVVQPHPQGLAGSKLRRPAESDDESWGDSKIPVRQETSLPAPDVEKAIDEKPKAKPALKRPPPADEKKDSQEEEKKKPKTPPKAVEKPPAIPVEKLQEVKQQPVVASEMVAPDDTPTNTPRTPVPGAASASFGNTPNALMNADLSRIGHTAHTADTSFFSTGNALHNASLGGGESHNNTAATSPIKPQQQPNNNNGIQDVGPRRVVVQSQATPPPQQEPEQKAPKPIQAFGVTSGMNNPAVTHSAMSLNLSAPQPIMVQQHQQKPASGPQYAAPNGGMLFPGQQQQQRTDLSPYAQHIQGGGGLTVRSVTDDDEDEDEESSSGETASSSGETDDEEEEEEESSSEEEDDSDASLRGVAIIDKSKHR